ncbi:MAG: N-6 DNA methylase, partial [Candidatus Marinimicrobia bacterium]|nr:N-6 DNA methylase [Candidatus Neomarinimicrobiota bacterium]
MNKHINDYLQNINTRYRTGISTEHSYRGDLQRLVENLAPGVLATNEPARVACGAPDYIITKRNIPVGYIEAKDIGKPLDSKEYKEQFNRYKKSLQNLIITDYLDFRLYIDGKFITSVKIAEIEKGKIHPEPENFGAFTDLIINFCTYVGQTIKSPSVLSKMMAGKARLLETVIERALLSDEDNEADSTLKEQMKAFKDVLIHDITPSEFADIYAQTIAYGMFAARLHDRTLEDFSRQEAAELIPKTNPFLRKLFQYIAGYDLDDRIKWIVDALAEIFRATNVADLLKDFGSATQQNDPMVHFYEKFLAEYNPKLRKSRGVWYTPEPVVNFIVRAVDDILKTEFGLSQGLADTSKTTIEIDTQTPDKRSPTAYKRIKQEVHKVQILDPAAGTGTFLAEIVKHIYKKFAGQQGIWNNYVENHLIPRLNGFELLMASYAMAHLKLDLLLRETGYNPKKEQRFRIFLTNSLEEHHPDTGTLFANWLSTEANEANHIKRDTPVMCVIGNPPYSGISINKGAWITSLIEDYKYVNGIHFGERKHWLQDDYVKFLRFGEHFINKNGEGVLAFINNHSFIDNPTFRGMRWHLLESFDKIYIIDLHGNSKKKEVCPDGSKDENVFDIT